MQLKAFRHHLLAGLEKLGCGFEHHRHDARHARHHDHVAQHEAWRDGDRVLDEFCAEGDARHAQPRRREFDAATLEVGFHGGERALVHVDADAEGLCHCVRRDVVVGGPNAARREDVVEARAQGIQGGDDLVLHIRHDADFAQLDADGGEMIRDVANVLVFGAADRISSPITRMAAVTMPSLGSVLMGSCPYRGRSRRLALGPVCLWAT